MKNPFLIFEIPPAVDIDLTELTARYRVLVTNHHPDRGGDAITMEDINAAYSILKNLIKRARALVEFHGIIITDEQTLTDSTILEEIFELRMSNDKDLIRQKQKEALRLFKNVILGGDPLKIQQAYWRLLYVDKLSSTVCHPDTHQDPGKIS